MRPAETGYYRKAKKARCKRQNRARFEIRLAACKMQMQCEKRKYCSLRIAICRLRFIIGATYGSRCKGRTACCVSARPEFRHSGIGNYRGWHLLLPALQAAIPRRAEQQLSAIAELKVDELVQYRKERLGDAVIFFKNTAFSGLVRRFLDHPEDTEAQQQIQEWAGQMPGDRSV